MRNVFICACKWWVIVYGTWGMCPVCCCCQQKGCGWDFLKERLRNLKSILFLKLYVLPCIGSNCVMYCSKHFSSSLCSFQFLVYDLLVRPACLEVVHCVNEIYSASCACKGSCNVFEFWESLSWKPNTKNIAVRGSNNTIFVPFSEIKNMRIWHPHNFPAVLCFSVSLCLCISSYVTIQSELIIYIPISF